MTSTNAAVQLGLPFGSSDQELEIDVANSSCQGSRQSLVVATWNVNSVRARLDLVAEWLHSVKPDVLCLQETKVSDDLFPVETFSRIGYRVAVCGQQARNGVAIVSRHSITNIEAGFDDSPESEARILSVTIEGLRIVNVYVPNAHSTTDPRFAFKVEWLGRLGHYLEAVRKLYPDVLVCGDFNVSPRDSDVHDSSLWLYRTFVHPGVRAALSEVVSQGLIDLHLRVNDGAIAYTWWDYRQDAFARGNGMRIDHFYATEAIARRCTNIHVDAAARAAEKPSDHAPVVATLQLKRSQ